MINPADVPYTPLQRIQKYIQWRKGSVGSFAVHSPFLYPWSRQVLFNKQALPAQLLQRKRELFQDTSPLSFYDYGKGKERQSTVKNIARQSAKRDKWLKVLGLSARYFKPETGLELGTSLGLSSASMALLNPQFKRFISLEGGAPQVTIAQTGNVKLGLNALEIIQGSFDQTLQPALKTLQQLDWVFVDGHHAELPTLDYIEKIMPFLHKGSVLILDDIHWSKGMENAWEALQNRSNVTLTVDLFELGFAFFLDRKRKEHHKIRV